MIDIKKLGHRWKGAYNSNTTYEEGDVVRQGDDVKKVNADGTLSDFAQGQQNIGAKGQILTDTTEPVQGKTSQVLHSASDGSNFKPQWRFTDERNGTKAVSLTDSRSKGHMKYYAGSDVVGAVMTDGTLRVIGNKRYGMGGVGDVNVSRGLAWVVPFPKGTYIVKAFNAPASHLFAIDSEGQLWGTGYDVSGNGTNSVCNMMTNISQGSDMEGETIVDFEAQNDWNGYRSCFAIAASGKVYAWGRNQFGQLGLGVSTDPVNTPTLVPMPDGIRINKVFTGGGYYTPTMMTDQNYDMWGCGYGLSYMGSNYTSNTFIKNTKFNNVGHMTFHESAGHWSGAGSYYRSSSITTRDGKLYIAELNVSGQVHWGSLGGGTDPDEPSPNDVWLTGVKYAAVKNGGYDQVVALMNDGTIKGRGYSPLSGTNTNTQVWTTWPTITDAVEMWGVGARHGQHVDILTQRGTIFSVGYSNGDGAGTQQQAGVTQASTLREVLHPYAFVDVTKAGYQYDGNNIHNTVALDEYGDVYIWGTGNLERGAGNDAEDMYVPTQIKF